jgi:hypothetical protein
MFDKSCIQESFCINMLQIIRYIYTYFDNNFIYDFTIKMGNSRI